MIDLVALYARHARLRWHRADMRGLDLGEHFDVVVVWDSFFHLPCADQRAMFPSFRAHTAPGGVLFLTSGVEEGEAVGGDLCGDTLFHASLDSAEYARRLDEQGYDVVLHRVQDPECGGHTVWIARLRDAGP